MAGQTDCFEIFGHRFCGRVSHCLKRMNQSNESSTRSILQSRQIARNRFRFPRILSGFAAGSHKEDPSTKAAKPPSRAIKSKWQKKKMNRINLSWLILLFGWLLLVEIVTSTAENATADPVIVDREVVKISFSELQSFSEGNNSETCRQEEGNSVDENGLVERLAQAFGPDGLGFVEVTDIPSEFVELRQQIMELAKTLATTLSQDELDTITLPETMYSIGWSHGKEKLSRSGEYDTGKGSFYFDPFRKDVNVYPQSLQPKLEDSLQTMTEFMASVGWMIAKLCDAYLGNTLVTSSLQTKVNTKARLLYYFPPPPPTTTTASKESSSFDDWCGWHTDHGSITALVPGHLFGEEEAGTPHNNNNKDGDKSNNKNYKAGLYIQTRKETTETVHVKLPTTSLGFQVGETVEIMSGGKLRATPHAVRGNSPGRGGGGRASLAVFLQPEANQELPPIVSQSSTESRDGDASSLSARWRSTFGEFQLATIQAFQ